MWKAILSAMSAYTFLHSEPAAELHPHQYYLVLRPPLAQPEGINIRFSSVNKLITQFIHMHSYCTVL